MGCYGNMSSSRTSVEAEGLEVALGKDFFWGEGQDERPFDTLWNSDQFSMAGYHETEWRAMQESCEL